MFVYYTTPKQWLLIEFAPVFSRFFGAFGYPCLLTNFCIYDPANQMLMMGSLDYIIIYCLRGLYALELRVQMLNALKTSSDMFARRGFVSLVYFSCGG
jgi:hypothetical protein